MAAEIRKWAKVKAGVAPNDNSVHRAGVVFVTRRGHRNNLRMALLARQGLYVLDTKVGPVRLKGAAARASSRRSGGAVRYGG